jgi:hypothetical protein
MLQVKQHAKRGLSHFLGPRACHSHYSRCHTSARQLDLNASAKCNFCAVTPCLWVFFPQHSTNLPNTMPSAFYQTSDYSPRSASLVLPKYLSFRQTTGLPWPAPPRPMLYDLPPTKSSVSLIFPRTYQLDRTNFSVELSALCSSK